MLMLNRIHLLVTVIFIIITFFCGNGEAGFARLKDVSRHFRALSFEEAYSVMWGNPSIVPADQGDAVHLQLDTAYSGSGIVSLENYMYGFYSVSLKFPVQAYSAGLVLAFYVSLLSGFNFNVDGEKLLACKIMSNSHKQFQTNSHKDNSHFANYNGIMTFCKGGTAASRTAGAIGFPAHSPRVQSPALNHA